MLITGISYLWGDVESYMYILDGKSLRDLLRRCGILRDRGVRKDPRSWMMSNFYIGN